MDASIERQFELVTTRVACRLLRMDHRTLKILARHGKIDFVETPSGHRRYAVYAYLQRETAKNRGNERAA